MISIDEVFVDSVATNSDAAANGRDLLRKGKVAKLSVDEDETILFGECAGSGKTPYSTSIDFVNPSNPVYRCTCPSRQFPCKHALAIMYAWARKNKFTTAPAPADVLEKRAKTVERAEKKKERAETPKKVNLSALGKKIDTQLEGLDLLETMTQDLVRSGLGTMSAKSAQHIEERAKQLGNMYLPGAQNALRAFTTLFHGGTEDPGAEEKRREAVYTEALDQLTRLHMIVKRGREYLSARKADPEMKPESTSNIAEWLGHAWQLSELKDAGLVQENASLIQLYFCTREDDSRKEVVETGVWLNLAGGAIQLTKNYRPYHALKFIKEDDAFFQVIQAPELSVYPGDMNPRIRWADASHRMVSVLEREAALAFARPNLAEALKAAKAQLKDPLAEKCPFVLVRFASILEADGRFVLQDAAGERIALVEDPELDPLPTVHLLKALDPALLTNQAMLLRLIPDLDTMSLKAKPLTIVTVDSIVRLAL